MDAPFKQIDPKQEQASVIYKLLIGGIVRGSLRLCDWDELNVSTLQTPRPIAFVSSQDEDGNQNLAPFSYFAPCGHNPPMVRSRRPHTTRYLRLTALPSGLHHLHRWFSLAQARDQAYRRTRATTSRRPSSMCFGADGVHHCLLPFVVYSLSVIYVFYFFTQVRGEHHL